MSRTKTKTVVVFQGIKNPKLYLQTMKSGKSMTPPKGFKLVESFSMEVA